VDLRKTNEHLTPEEILIALRSSGHSENDGFAQECQAHIDQCPACAQIKEEYKKVLSKLHEFGRAGRTTPGRDCFPAYAWAELAAGLSSQDETFKRLKHASSCRECAFELENALDAIGNSEPPPLEIEQNLETGTREWQQKFAVQMASRSDDLSRADKATSITASKNHPATFHARNWVYAGLAAAIVAAIGVGLFSRLQSSSPEQLIAQAYAQQRTIELRIPGAGYGPIQVERASGRSQSNSPAALLEAESIIRRQMEKTPQDPELLREKAEADLLNWDYQPAIETLGQALRLRPNSFYLLVDLATAHFERGEARSEPADYEAGLQYLGDAIRIEPNNPEALFNRAIIYERLYLYGRAIADWEQFLKIEKESGWRKEAEKRLQELRLREHQRSLRHVPERLSLVQFKDDLKTKQATSVEEYLEVAERQILPNISAPIAQDENYQTATALANVLKSDHGDPFLSDLLQSASVPAFHDAIKLLGQSSSANHDGHAEEAYADAAQAAALFQKSGNVAGLLASRFEQTYALQFESKADSCQSLAGESVGMAHQHSYSALEVQLLL
jgi:tetratricopeptide (TPR) repeat protein